MGSQSEPITTTDVLDYTWEALMIGATFGKSPLLSLAGLDTGYRVISGNQFSMGTVITGDSPSQTTVSEDASITTITATSYTGSQGTNYAEIHELQYVISYASQALNGVVSGVANVKEQKAGINGMPKQRLAHMKQLMCNLEYSATRGSEQAWTNAATAGQTGGLVTAIEAGSETDAGGAALSRTLINTEVARMAAAGAEFENVVMACGAHQYQALSDLYGFVPQSRSAAGVDIQQVLLPVAGNCGVVYDPVLASDDLVFVDLAHFTPCFGVVPGKPPIFTEPLAKLGAADREMLFAIFAIDYENIAYHGMVSGLATS